MATGAGTASTAVGLAVPLFAGYAPVAFAVSAGLGVLSTHAHVALAVGADGSGEAAAVAAAATVAGTAGGVVGGLAVRAGPVVRQAARSAGDGADVTAVATEIGAVLGRRGDGEAPGSLPGLDGASVAVTVHDVDSPWHVGHGMRGQGFVGVAVVPVAGRQRDRERARSR